MLLDRGVCPVLAPHFKILRRSTARLSLTGEGAGAWEVTTPKG
jgi:hypothetical protein